ncbi:MAG: type III-B CRISPR module RAMP protein Cmr4, partial [candidate division WOR-3 bacterium]|nr:type III-B CRISPR module RAMP protein Cmr4 [candidate division WOR-3 bacterium]MDW8150856.1 type III-B CRISPR module RAMP protein Cmr4 [candidate division WOR-3 bacterium]
KGVFAWITCPMVLERFKKDLKLAGITDFNFSDFQNLQNTIPNTSNIEISSKIVLEEFTFEVIKDQNTTKLAEWLSDNIFPNDNSYQFWRDKLKKDLVILSDDDFKHFVKSSTEVITRTKIDDVTGTVQSGALWTEEYLPQDTIMYSIVMFSQPRVEDDKKGVFKDNTPAKEAKLIAEFFTKGIPEVIQIGGSQTVGKGFMRVKFL